MVRLSMDSWLLFFLNIQRRKDIRYVFRPCLFLLASRSVLDFHRKYTYVIFHGELSTSNLF